MNRLAKLWGKRNYEEVNGTTKVFSVQGFNRRGFYWLEYHLENGSGGGTIMLHDQGTGNMRGLITAGHCDNSALRCYYNQWVQKDSIDDSVEYDPQWQMEIGIVP